jgi:uncharacterized protein involved in outer membrane biogenesis
MKKILIGVAVFVFVAALGLFFWARAVLGGDGVRTALAAQVSEAIGQPVTISSISATIYPRITVNLGGVTIGNPARIQVRTLQVGTALGALLSRRIEHASVRLAGARIELPLPPFTIAATKPAGSEPADSPVRLVSVDEIVLSEVEVVSGGRTLTGDIEVVPQGNGLLVRKVSLGAGDAKVDAMGEITDLSAPAGRLSLKAGALNVDELLAFATEFSSGAGLNSASASKPAVAPAGGVSATPNPGAMNIALSIDAERATMGGLTLEALKGQARLTSDGATLEPISFGLFGGRYEGALALTLADKRPTFRWNAVLSGIDVAAATAYAGSPGTISGRLSGKIELRGQGADAASAIKTARGTARVDLTDGIVKNLGLVRTIVTATSGRSGATVASGSGDEPFSKLGATLNIANGSANTADLVFESKDLRLGAAGTVRLDGTAINLAGNVQLSEALTEQAGRDLVRYTQDQGRVTLPATITGSAAAPSVRIDVAAVARRAITNRATEESQRLIKKGLGGLLGR